MNTQDKIDVMQAYVDGSKVEIKGADATNWKILNMSPTWNWGFSEYRIKPQPESVWVNKSENGVLYTHSTESEAIVASTRNYIYSAKEFREVTE